MKIVITVNPEQTTPPKLYGGTQRRADFIARGLKDRGHNVMLLCGPGSECPVSKIMTSTPSMAAEWEYIKWLRDNKGWDCLLDMTAHHLSSQPIGLVGSPPTLAMMSGDPLRKYAHNDVRNRMYVSHEFAKFNRCPNHPVVLNIPTDKPPIISSRDLTDSYCLYVGVIRPEKGIHLAALACKLLGIRLKVIGPSPGWFKSYFESFKGQVEYLGTLGDDKWKVFANAAAFVFPSLWCDASPLVVKESLLCGTPVVGCPNGGIVEDIENDVNGYLVKPSLLAMGIGEALNKQWDREAIQKTAIEKMNPKTYIDKIEALLIRVAKGERW